MSDQMDNRPVFTMVMGCNGVGKSTWKRANYDRLPDRFYDQDSITGGIGDWNDPAARERTTVIVEREIEEAITGGEDFGIESTSSGIAGVRRLEQAVAAGYRIEGVYLGTSAPEINVERIRHRVARNTGHAVDSKRIPNRYRYSLSHLRKHADRFDALEIMDNSIHDEDRSALPATQIVMERGRVVDQAGDMEEWCERWLSGYEQSQRSKTRLAEKRRRENKRKREIAEARELQGYGKGYSTHTERLTEHGKGVRSQFTSGPAIADNGKFPPDPDGGRSQPQPPTGAAMNAGRDLLQSSPRRLRGTDGRRVPGGGTLSASGDGPPR